MRKSTKILFSVLIIATLSCVTARGAKKNSNKGVKIQPRQIVQQQKKTSVQQQKVTEQELKSFFEMLDRELDTL